MSVTLYAPRDAVALGLGANKVARALFAGAERRGLDVTIVRTGSRGLFWLEPMVEIGTPEGRVAYGPVTVKDVDALLDAGLTTGGDHALRLGDPEKIPYLARQQRLAAAAADRVLAQALGRHAVGGAAVAAGDVGGFRGAHAGAVGYRRRYFKTRRGAAWEYPGPPARPLPMHAPEPFRRQLLEALPRLRRYARSLVHDAATVVD